MIRASMSREEVAATVCQALADAGIRVVLSGGAVVSLYSDAAYVYSDPGFVQTELAHRVDPEMRESEAKRRVGSYHACVASPDTHDEAAAVQRAALRRLGGEGRVALAFRMTRDAREIAASGLQRRHPELSREEARLRVIRRALGEELFAAAYGRRRM